MAPYPGREGKSKFKPRVRDKGKIKKSFKSKPGKLLRKVGEFKPRKKANELSKVDQEKCKKYNRGKPTDSSNVKFKVEKTRIANREEKIQYGVHQSVRSEALLTEESGFLVPDSDEITTQFSQKNIKNAVDPLSASKGFELDLKFGPYRMNYTRNGKFLLLGGRRGHVAAMDWVKKKLLCEINVMEEVYDVAWFHQETLFAVAQKKWVYVYDNQGIEIHCLKQMNDIYRMLFLPYHFLLATVSTKGFISWLDVSIGKMVQQFPMHCRGNASATALHPSNAMVCVGESNGVVSFWGPNNKKPAVTKMCHKRPISSVAFDPRGVHFATAAIGGEVKIWDARNLNGPLHNYVVRTAPYDMSISHKGVMALALGNLIEIYTDEATTGLPRKKIYLRHTVPSPIVNLDFCPYEDILGVAHSTGFCSMLVPGCGEENFDALEANPFQTKSQRREAEVKALLGKIPADLITWDSNQLLKVDLPSREEVIEAKKQLINIKAPNVQMTPRKKTGRKAGSVKTAQRKKIMKEDFRRNYVKEMKELKEASSIQDSTKDAPTPSSSSVLDRFKKR